MIKRITERVSPRVFRVVALPAPTDRQKTQIYMQRYVEQLPAAGEVVIFDRSWYNRPGVERVMGFCSEQDAKRYLALTPRVETYLIESGITLVKYFLTVSELFDAAVPAILDRQDAVVDQLHAREQVVDRHHAAILGFVEKVLQPELAPDLCRTAVELVEAADYLEAIGDLVDKEMVPLYRRHVERGTEIDAQARERLRALAEAVGQELRRSLRAVAEADQALARSVLDTKSQVRNLERAAIELQVESQPADGPQRLLPNALERELAESIRRTYSLVRRLARVGTGLPRIDTEEGAEQEAA